MGFDRVALVAVGVALAACGDDSGTARVDAGDGSADANDIGTGIPCQYTEMQDATNGVPAMAENSNLTLGTERLAICGRFDATHFDANEDLVDGDAITFNVTAQTNVIVHLIGPGIAQGGYDFVGVGLQRGNALFGQGVFHGDHATFAYTLPVGTYVLGVFAANDSAATAPVNYQVLISVDTPRCAAKTTTADHTEGADGGANDVIDYFFASNQTSSLTPGADAPETTNVTVASGSSYLIDGSMADVDPQSPDDDYEDTDTFLFTTGATTTQMSVRINWAGTSTDLDYRVYPVPTGDPSSIVGGLDSSNMEDEFETFSVMPNTSYWLWVASEDGAASPMAYKATLCGETFTP